MADRELSALKRQRTMNKNKLLRLLEFARGVDDTRTLEELNVRFEQVVKLHEALSNVEAQIAATSETEEADPSIDETYYEAAALLKGKIRNIQVQEPQLNQALNFTTNASNIGHQSEVKLPKLYIQPFSGDYADWPSFFDMFCTTIHETNLSGVEKFQYLKGLLRGEAAALLKHIRVTESNYLGAFNKLKERYDNGKFIIHSYIKTFMEQPTVQSNNLTSLRKLRDVSDEVIRGLNALGDQAEARDPWVIYLLLKKVDEKTEIAWANFSNDNAHPSITEFLKFLDKRISALETCSPPEKRITRNSVRGHLVTNEQQSRSNSHSKSDNIKFKCAMCADQSHFLLQCEKFHGMDAVKRKEFIQAANRCYNCLSAKHPVSQCPSKRRCQQCGRKHHSLIHFEETKAPSHPMVNAESGTTATHVTSLCHAYSGVPVLKRTILPTALVGVLNQNDEVIYCRALLDSGSQVSFITEDCAQRLKLQRVNSRISVSGIGDTCVGATKGKIKLAVKVNQSIFEINALVLRKITCPLPLYDISRDNIKLPENIELADSEFHISRAIDILIGADHFFSCLEAGQMKLPSSTLVLQKTIFGWIVSGQMNELKREEHVSMLATKDSTKIIDIDQTLRRFWEVEEVTSLKQELSEEEMICEEKFIATTKLDEDGHFVVQLPFKQSPKKLGGTLSVAIKRLQGVEKRFSRDPEFKRLYCEFMSEYQAMGHMVEIPENQTSQHSCFYLPHHGVLRMESTTTKLRVVFDGSVKSTTGISLNECLAAGPVVQPSLFAIMLRFREYPVAFSADAEKMYRMVKLATSDTEYQRIVWRNDVSDPIKHFRLLTVTYGLTSASYLATRTLQKIAEIYADSHQHASSIIQKCFYVDDLMSGAQTVEEANQIITSLCDLLGKHGFKLRKWKTNCPLALRGRHESLLDTSAKIFGEQDVADYAVKVLGVSWNPEQDHFTFDFKPDDSKKVYTKRGVLSAAGKLFDPMGWLSPSTVMVKIFMQQLWCKKLGWDDHLPEELNRQWLSIINGLGQVGYISLPRHIGTITTSKIEIHGFCDASAKAYAAVVYYRFLNANNQITVQLVASKTKVAPMKQLSLPRLELCGALLLAKLVSVIIQEAGVQILNCTYWTDSKIVLDWLQSYPRRWSTFVGNRTSEIKSHFLHGYSPTTIPSVDVAHLNPSTLTRWRAINDMVHHFWKRWYIEYITSLQCRSKWQQDKKQIQVDDIVLIQDTGLPISHWLLGKVIQIHPGVDKRVRVVTLKTANGEIKRSIHRLCLLPITNQISNDYTNVPVGINNLQIIPSKFDSGSDGKNNSHGAQEDRNLTNQAAISTNKKHFIFDDPVN